MAELDPRPTVMRHLHRVAHLAAVLPSHHSPSSETESRSPVFGQLVAYSCLSVHVHSLPPSVVPPQTSAPTQNSSITEQSVRENGRSSVRPRYFCRGVRTKNELDGANASRASRSPPQCYLRFEAVTSNSLCLTM